MAFWNSIAEGVGYSQPDRSDAARLATRLLANQNVSRPIRARREDLTRAETASDTAISSAK